VAHAGVLLGVREDFPIYTSWHRAAGIRRDRPHLYARRRAELDAGWRTGEQAARDQARADDGVSAARPRQRSRTSSAL